MRLAKNNLDLIGIYFFGKFGSKYIDVNASDKSGKTPIGNTK